MYGTAAGYKAYWLARGTDQSAVLDDTVNAALLVASEWIDGIYGDSFVGHKTGGFTQTNQWPRTSATVTDGGGYWKNYYTFPDNVIPDQVTNATYEAAMRHITTPGSLQPDYKPNKYKSVAVSGAVSVEYAPFSNASDLILSIGVVDTLLWPLLDESSAVALSGLSGPSVRV